MQTLRSRLIFSHILPLLLVAPLIAVALIYLLETQILIASLSAQIYERALLVSRAINPESDILTDPTEAQALLLNLSQEVHGGIYLLTPDGQLIASAFDEPGMPFDLEMLAAAPQTFGKVQVVYRLEEQNMAVLTPILDINRNLVGIVAVSESIRGVASQFTRLRWLVLGTLAIEVIIAAAVGLILARRLAQPIQNVSNAVAEIAEGSRGEPILPEGPLEIRRLSASVNSLSEQLRSLEEIRKRSLANIVHEIGRPLGAIGSAIHTLRQEAGNDPQIREELLAGVEKEIQRMTPLLDDLTQIHGQGTEGLQLNIRKTDLKTWLPSNLLSWRAAAQEKDLQWKLEIDPQIPPIGIDPERVGQITGNLLSNAIKYTPAGGSVTVRAGVEPGEVWIQIEDTGPGISAEEQQLVFEPFYRSSTIKRFPQGLGLGLTIARDLAEAHGGTLVLESEAGRGCTFTLHLPT